MDRLLISFSISLEEFNALKDYEKKYVCIEHCTSIVLAHLHAESSRLWEREFELRSQLPKESPLRQRKSEMISNKDSKGWRSLWKPSRKR